MALCCTPLWRGLLPPLPAWICTETTLRKQPRSSTPWRTAFLSAIYFLENRDYVIPEYLPKGEVIRFCLAVAEENMRLAAGEPIIPTSIPEIAAWFRRLLSSSP